LITAIDFAAAAALPAGKPEVRSSRQQPWSSLARVVPRLPSSRDRRRSGCAWRAGSLPGMERAARGAAVEAAQDETDEQQLG
jgi:hypothetical protein